jgi:hypothetical protein
LFGTIWTLIAGTMFALLSPGRQLVGVDAMTLTKVVSLSLGIHGFFRYCDPNTFVHKVSGKQKEGM